MIDVTRFNNSTFVINAELIQTIEETPDTVITLTNGAKYVVKESGKQIKEEVLAYKRKILNPFD